MIQKLSKFGYRLLNDLNKISQKLQKSENLTVKNLGKKMIIPDEQLHPLIN